MKKLSKANIITFCESNSLKFCSNDYIGAEYIYTFECTAGHEFSRRYGNLTQNPKCPTCKKQEVKQYNKLDLEYWIKYCKDKDIEVLSNKYKNARTALHLKCKICSCEFHNSPCNIKAGSGCPKCNNATSKVEEKVREIFESKFGKLFPSIRPNFMKNPKTKMNLELDGYCEELKLAFEYDGEFHYKENPYRSEGLQKRKELDRLKDMLCKKNKVKLIRIPYTEKDNLIEFIESLEKLKENI